MMKIAFIIEYFTPFAEGGSEWSTYYLAEDLVSKGDNVVVFTPNYGFKSEEFISGFKVVRFPFYMKLGANGHLPGNFAFTNPLWIFWLFTVLVYKLSKENVDVIHVQGKYSAIPAYLANLFLGKRILVTVRDYIPICNYGLCIRDKDKACTNVEFFRREFFEYYSTYVNKKNMYSLFINLLFAIYGKISSKILAFILRRMQTVVLSKKQALIFRKNGFKNVKTIANSYKFTKFKLKNKTESVLYVGRLTSGKGVGILIPLVVDLVRDYKKLKFIFIGQGPLENRIKGIQSDRVLLTGKLEHSKVMKYMAKAKVVVVPSLWPEPFGRVALEAIANGTPVVVTDRGGLPDIVADNRWGVVVKPEPEKIKKAIEELLKHNISFQRNILKDFGLIKKKFGEDISLKYIRLYKNL